MNLNISYRHLDPSDSVDAKIREKVDHLKKYFQGKLKVDWVCSVDAHRQHRSEVNVHYGAKNFHAHAVDENLYASFDIVLQKLEKQIQKKNAIRKNHIHNNANSRLDFA